MHHQGLGSRQLLFLGLVGTIAVGSCTLDEPVNPLPVASSSGGAGSGSASSGASQSASSGSGDPGTFPHCSSADEPVCVVVDDPGPVFGLASDLDNVYWASGSASGSQGEIRKALASGAGLPMTLFANRRVPRELVVASGNLWWRNLGNGVGDGSIERRYDVFDASVEVDSLSGGHLAVGSGRIYWTQPGSAAADQIWSCVPSACVPSLLVLDAGVVTQLRASPTGPVWMSSFPDGANALFTCASESCAPKAIISPTTDLATGLAVWGDEVYFQWKSGLNVCPISAGPCVMPGILLPSAPSDVVELETDGVDVFLLRSATGLGGSIEKCSTFGCLQPTSLAHSESPEYLALDSHHVYWFAPMSHEILRAKK